MINLTSEKLVNLRNIVQKHFSAETSLSGDSWAGGSAGHCVMIAMLLNSIFGAKFLSTKMEPVNHWFSRVLVNGQIMDVDLTGDQFGHEPVRIKPPGELYPDTKERQFEEINEETLKRFVLFVNKLNFEEIKSV